LKRLTPFLVLALLGSCNTARWLSLSPPAHAAALEITTEALPLNKGDPKQNRVGELVYRGGLVLRSANKDFGGISAMRVRADHLVLAISDAGSWISFKLIEKDEQLVGVAGIGLAPMLDAAGKPGHKASRDAEALEVGATTSVAFEGDHRIWVYPDIDPAKPETFTAPARSDWRKPWMLMWPNNGGAEAMCQLEPAKNTLLITEDAAGPDASKAGFLSTATADVRFGYQPEAGFKPTDCAALPTQMQALVLQRRFSPFTGVAASLAVADFQDVKSDTVIAGREIARLVPPVSVDNMEGISYLERAGHKYIYIISDDNFSGLQRTLLMKFEWLPQVQK
jgi:hypothetical protein